MPRAIDVDAEHRMKPKPRLDLGRAMRRRGMATEMTVVRAPFEQFEAGGMAAGTSIRDVDRGNPVLGSGGPRAMQWALKLLF